MCTPNSISRFFALVVLAALATPHLYAQNWEEPRRFFSIWPGEYGGWNDGAHVDLILYPDKTFHLSRQSEIAIQTGRGEWTVTTDSLFLSFNSPFTFQSPTWSFDDGVQSNDSLKVVIVYDKLTGDPVPGAQIWFQGNEEVAYGRTWKDGKASVKLIPEIEYKWLVVKFVGFTTVRIPYDKATSQSSAVVIELTHVSNLEVLLSNFPVGHRQMPPKYEMGFRVEESESKMHSLYSDGVTIRFVN